jgi:hypothetical protein
VTGQLTVVAASQAPVQTQVPVKPKGAPETGELDSAPSSTPFVLGGAAALLLGSAGAGGWLYRRRRQAG